MKKIALLAAAIAISGCANSPSKQAQLDNISSAPLDITHHLYGKLDSVGGDYQFTQFSEQPGDGAWVRLSDLEPTWSTEKENCLTGLVEYTNDEITCKTASEDQFREKSVDFTPKKTAAYVTLSALTFGVWSVMPPGAVEFNAAAYKEAVTKAKQNLLSEEGLSEAEYTKLLRQYDQIVESFQDRDEKIRSGYSRFRPSPKIRLNDQSGLYEGKAEAFRRAVSLSHNTLSIPKSRSALSDDQLRQLVVTAKASMDDFLDLVTKQSSKVDVKCSNKSFNGIHYRISCPDSVDRGTEEFVAEVTIESRSYDNVAPKELKLSDQAVDVTLSNGSITVANKTKSYISVDSISYYYNGRVVSQSLSEEIAPLSSRPVLNVRDLPIEKQRLAFSGVTKAKAQKTLVEFGLASKYRVVDLNREKTLLSTNNYTLYDLLED